MAVSGNANLDILKKFGVETLFRSVILVCEWLTGDENVQVNGLFVLVDLTGATIAHHTQIMNIENAKKMLQFYQVSIMYTGKCLQVFFSENFFLKIKNLRTVLIISSTKLKKVLWRISQTWPRGYKTFSMLNLTKHESFPAHKS